MVVVGLSLAFVAEAFAPRRGILGSWNKSVLLDVKSSENVSKATEISQEKRASSILLE